MGRRKLDERLERELVEQNFPQEEWGERLADAVGRCVYDLLDPTSGEVRFVGSSVKSSPDEIIASLSMIPSPKLRAWLDGLEARSLDPVARIWCDRDADWRRKLARRVAELVARGVELLQDTRVARSQDSVWKVAASSGRRVV